MYPNPFSTQRLRMRMRLVRNMRMRKEAHEDDGGQCSAVYEKFSVAKLFTTSADDYGKKSAINLFGERVG